MKNPLVSAIVPLYNKEKWVARCIESIIRQSYQNMEILIINDGSTDNSLQVIKTIEDKRIKIIDKPNGGVSSARNLGIENAKGEFIAFLDADDKWESRHIEFLVKGFEIYNNASMIANQLEDRLSSNEIKSNKSSPKYGTDIDVEYSNEDYLDSLSKGLFPMHIGSAMFKKSLLDIHAIRFYEHIKMGEDVNFTIRVSRLGQCIVSNYVGFIYYHDDENSAMNMAGKEAALTPLYFYGVEQEKWPSVDKKKIIKFLRREYIKKAYQNRGLVWRKEELSSEVGGGVEIGKLSVALYLAIRYTPEFIYGFYRKIKMIRQKHLKGKTT